VIEDGNDMLQVWPGAGYPARGGLRQPQEAHAILAKTEKGHDVDFMAGQVKWHGGGINEEDYNRAIESLDKNWKERKSKWQ
jgi:transketolase